MARKRSLTKRLMKRGGAAENWVYHKGHRDKNGRRHKGHFDRTKAMRKAGKSSPALKKINRNIRF